MDNVIEILAIFSRIRLLVTAAHIREYYIRVPWHRCVPMKFRLTAFTSRSHCSNYFRVLPLTARRANAKMCSFGNVNACQAMYGTKPSKHRVLWTGLGFVYILRKAVHIHTNSKMGLNYAKIHWVIHWLSKLKLGLVVDHTVFEEIRTEIVMWHVLVVAELARNIR